MQTSKKNPGYYVPVNENGQALTTPDGKLVVEVMGSNVEEVWVEALAINDTNDHALGTIDVSDCDEFGILVASSMDEDVSIYLTEPNGRGGYGFTLALDDYESRYPSLLKMPKNNEATTYRNFKIKGLLSVNAFVMCGVAPTKGSISVYIMKKGRGI